MTHAHTSSTATLPTWEVESSIVDEGGEWIIGLDEVGRGCLAGPVTLGAAAFSAALVGTDTIPEGLKDSKLLTERKREALIEPIQVWASAVGTGSCTNHNIDTWGIGRCLGLAALKAIAEVENQLHTLFPESFTQRSKVAVILDGPHDYITPVIGSLDAVDMPVVPRIYTLIKGDQKCASVAAASVYAKVCRDHYMKELAEQHREWEAYEWAKNKGYGSAAHREAIKRYGVTPYHRISWKLV
ncbi:ribonuclease HII [Alloscardovia venturai]|uniref:Ribonuclease n=1 Tax=Alloscardovia venturai TaxID=1769421 RepID=A0ABW2Y5A4_9BIFI